MSVYFVYCIWLSVDSRNYIRAGHLILAIYMWIVQYYCVLFPCIQQMNIIIHEWMWTLVLLVAGRTNFYLYSDNGGDHDINNSLKNLISISNFTSSHKGCKMIWEFQICWGGTSLLIPVPIWRYLRYLRGTHWSPSLLHWLLALYVHSDELRHSVPIRKKILIT